MSTSRYREDLGKKVVNTLVAEVSFRCNSQPNNWSKPTKYFASSSNKPAYVSKKICVDELHPGPPYKTGGPFTKESYVVPYDFGKLAHRGTYYFSTGSKPGDLLYRFKGGFSLGMNPADYGGAPGTISNDLETSPTYDVSSYGAAAFNKFKPLRPRLGLAQTVAELKDIPSMLKKTSRHLSDVWRSLGGKRHIRNTPKVVADQFLAGSFGWLPFISDIRKFYGQFRRLDKDIGKLKRQNGKWVRKYGTVATEYETVGSPIVHSYTSHNPAFPWPFTPVASGSTVVTKYNTSSVTFVGMFRYYVPELSTPKWHDWAIKRLFGLQITPTLLYELTPWSWLVDWFSNAGDVISNIEDRLLYNMVCKYAYVMGRRQCNVDISSELPFNGTVLRNTWSHIVEYKTRHGCTPYSFSWDNADLTTYQKAILTALGVSRFR